MSEIAELYRSGSYSHRVAAEVRAHAARQGLMQKDLAKALGYVPSQVTKRMRGQIAFTLDELAILAALFGIQPAELLPTTRAFLGEGRATAAAQAAAAARVVTAGDLAAQAQNDQECTVRDSNPEPAVYDLRQHRGLVLLGSKILPITRTADPRHTNTRPRPRTIGHILPAPGAA